MRGGQEEEKKKKKKRAGKDGLAPLCVFTFALRIVTETFTAEDALQSLPSSRRRGLR